MEAWISWAVAIIREYWTWVASTGIAGLVATVMARARSAMIRRTARRIYEHMREKDEATRRRLGKGHASIEESLGISTGRQNAHRCDAACLKRERVLGVGGRWFVERAFKHLRDDGRVVFRGGFHYITGNEPESL